VSHDPERSARFEREAKVLASLNHPNIAQIYAVAEGALVMELVQGKTPAGAVPLETALSYARQIALALEAAHEKGIIHRDLKPGNIMITPEGVVKVLDFGLGLAYQSETARDPENSTTLTLANTQVGVVMGTPAYMSPEQAAGNRVDRRSDIWSFGVVLDEMLTGKRLFHGETASHTLASVLKEPIDFGRLPKTTPPAIRVLLERCLDRDPKLACAISARRASLLTGILDLYQRNPQSRKCEGSGHGPPLPCSLAPPSLPDIGQTGCVLLASRKTSSL